MEEVIEERDDCVLVKTEDGHLAIRSKRKEKPKAVEGKAGKKKVETKVLEK